MACAPAVPGPRAARRARPPAWPRADLVSACADEIDLLATARDALTVSMPAAPRPPGRGAAAAAAHPVEPASPPFEPPIPRVPTSSASRRAEAVRPGPPPTEPELAIFVPDDVEPVDRRRELRRSTPAAEPVPIFVPEPRAAGGLPADARPPPTRRSSPRREPSQADARHGAVHSLPDAAS